MLPYDMERRGRLPLYDYLCRCIKEDIWNGALGPGEKLPSQRKHLGAAFVGSDKDITTLIRRAKGVVEAMPRYTHMEAYTLRQVEKPVWADTVVWLNLYLGEEHIGDLALLRK